MFLQRMPQWQFRMEFVVVASAVASPREVSVGDEFGDDALRGALGDAHGDGDIS